MVVMAIKGHYYQKNMAFALQKCTQRINSNLFLWANGHAPKHTYKEMWPIHSEQYLNACTCSQGCAVVQINTSRRQHNSIALNAEVSPCGDRGKE
jgi:hypothetical protein